MSYDKNAYDTKYKKEREKYNISFNNTTNTIHWNTSTPESYSVPYRQENIDISPEMQKQLQELEYSIQTQRYINTQNPKGTYYTHSTMTPDEEKDWLQKMGIAYSIAVARGEKKGFGDWIKNRTGNLRNVPIPMGFGLGNNLTLTVGQVHDWLQRVEENSLAGRIATQQNKILHRSGS